MILKEEISQVCPTDWIEGILRAEPVEGVKIGYTSKLWGNGLHHLGLEDVNVTKFFRQLQRHTALVEEASLKSNLESFDASFTNQIGWQLNGIFADCLPLYMGTKKGNWIAFAHSGWKGSLLGIARNLVENLRKVSGKPYSELWCVLGPYRGDRCYEVQEDFLRLFRFFWKVSWLEICFQRQEDRIYFDNGLFNLLLLKDLGLEDLSFMPFSLGVDRRFYSYRNGEDGRNLGFIWREEVK